MANYLVVMCPKCGEIQAVDARYKRKTCVRCGFKFEIRKAKVLGVYGKGKLASEAVKKFKEMRGGGANPVWRRGTDYT